MRLLGVVTATKSLMRAPEKTVLIVDALNSQSGRARSAKLIVQVVKPARLEVAMHTSHYDVQIAEDSAPGTFVLHTNTTIANPALLRFGLSGPDADLFSVDELVSTHESPTMPFGISNVDGHIRVP